MYFEKIFLKFPLAQHTYSVKEMAVWGMLISLILMESIANFTIY